MSCPRVAERPAPTCQSAQMLGALNPMGRNVRAETDWDLGTRTSNVEPARFESVAVPEQFGERYKVLAVLGSGGMATVYRAEDRVSGRSVAIKHSSHRPDSRTGRELCALFAREFHLLAQLSHPRVIEVYDYGVEAGRPYYTMELLDGGDLRELAPLPWRKACAVIYDVCSSLALLHSRGFVHRDISPRNVRYTQTEHAKLIDFGAALQMGVAQQVVGTPAFVPPEALSRGALDARADLFSLGATFYFALTGELAYLAYQLGDLHTAFLRTPPAPSELAPDVPAALDELVMSLISLERAQRPRSAFEVMQRLAAIANLARDESDAVPAAYLSAPLSVGRATELALLQQKIAAGMSANATASLLLGPSGAGRTHLLDACAIVGKTLGATVLKVSAEPDGRRFSVAQALLTQLWERAALATWSLAQREQVADDLFHAPGSASEQAAAVPRELAQTASPMQTRAALERLLWALSREQPLLIVVDDLHCVDDASLSLLTALAQVKRPRLALLLAADSGAPKRAEGAFDVLASYCERIAVLPLSADASANLIASLFGDVPNLPLVCRQIYQVAQGNPGATLRLAQWLVQSGAIRYWAGTWTLPEQLSAADLPTSGERALVEQLGRLSPLARELAECQALAIHGIFTHGDYLRLAHTADPSAVERALLALVAVGILKSDGRSYTFTSYALAPQLLAASPATERERQHAALAHMFMAEGTPLVFAAHHLLECGQVRLGLERVAAHFHEMETEGGDITNNQTLPLEPEALAKLYIKAFGCTEQLGAGPRELGRYRQHMVLVSVVTDESLYWTAGSAWLKQLEVDSGLTHYRALRSDQPALERLGQAYAAAQQAYDQTPEAQRGYPPDEAIRMLVLYVVMSIAIAARSLDRRLITSLAPLLEPFVPLSPIVHAIWQNAYATSQNQAAQLLQATAGWQSVNDALGSVSGQELRYVAGIRNAVAFGIGTIEAGLGFRQAERWVGALDSDPLQRVNAMYLRKVIALLQGDWETADGYRKQAELLAAHAAMRQLLPTLLPSELAAHALAGDLAGVKHISERIDILAERHASWRAFAQLARGQFERLRGDFVQARELLEACLHTTDPRNAGELATLLAFCPAAAAYVDVLVDLGQPAQAEEWGRTVLELMHSLHIDAASWELERAVALAEARQPDKLDAAALRLDLLIERQRTLGASGLLLGATYEARARVAIHALDGAATRAYAQRTAEEYRHGLGSVLGARYDRLCEEARRAGIDVV